MPSLDLSSALDLRVANKNGLEVRIANKKIWEKPGAIVWTETRRNLFTHSYTSAGTLSDQGAWRRGTRLTSSPERLLSLITGNTSTGLTPSTTYRFMAKIRRSGGLGTVTVAARPAVGSGNDSVTLVSGLVVSTTETTLDYTFTTSAVAMSSTAGIAITSGSGAIGEYLEILESSVLIATDPDTGAAFNGATPDTSTERYTWLGAAWASQSIMETTEPPVNPWTLTRRNLFTHSYDSGQALTDQGDWMRGTRTSTSAARLISLTTGLTGLAPSTTYRFTAKVRRSGDIGTISVQARPDATQGVSQVTLVSGLVVSTTETTLDYTFTTAADAMTATAGIALVSGSGDVGAYLEILESSVLIATSPDSGSAFNGATLDTSTERYSWVGTPWASQSIMETTSTPIDPWNEVRRNLFTHSYLSTQTLSDQGAWKRATRTATGAVRMFSLITGLTGLAPSTKYRFTAKLRRSGVLGDISVYVRPDTTTGVPQITLANSIPVDTVETPLDFTFTTGPDAMTANAGIAIVSYGTSGSIGDYLEILEDSVLIAKDPDVGTAFNGDTTDTATARYTWLGTPWASQSIKEVTDDDTGEGGGGNGGGDSGTDANFHNINFDTWPLGTVTGAYLDSQIPTVSYASGGTGGVGTTRLQVVPDPQGGRRLQFLTPQGAGGSGPASGATFAINFSTRTIAEMEYVVEFDNGSPNFDWAEGGKMPGLDGGNQVGGGHFDPNGLSARLMWQGAPTGLDGELIVYLYWQGQKLQTEGKAYGDRVALGVICQRGQKYTIRQRVVMNTPGVNNGSLEVWIDKNDGKGLVSRHFSHRMWRRAGSPVWGVDGAKIVMFHGGGADKHQADRDSKMYVDNVKVHLP